MPTQLKMTRSGIKSKYAGKILNEEIRKDLVELGGVVDATYLSQVVSRWDDPVTFKVSVQSTGSRITLSLIPQGSEEAILNWKLVNEGRAGGTEIKAKNPSGVMRFMTGYVKKTGLAVAGFGTPGERFGDWVSAAVVTQGAVEAGNYILKAQEAARPEYNRRIKNAYQRAWVALKQASR